MKALEILKISRSFLPLVQMLSEEEFNQIVQELDEAIAELETLESRSCGNCLHYDDSYCTNLHLDKMLDEFQELVGFIRVYKGFGCKLWEAKQ